MRWDAMSARLRRLKRRSRRAVGLARRSLVDLLGDTHAAIRALLLKPISHAAVRRPAGLLRATRLLRRVAPSDPSLARAEILLTARTSGWAAASRVDATSVWSPLSVDGPRADPLARVRTSLLDPSRIEAFRPLVVPAHRRSTAIPLDRLSKTVVYTAAFDREESLPPVQVGPNCPRFVCFTDHDVSAKGWDVVRCGPGHGDGDPSTRHRVLAHEVLAGVAPDSEWSLYVDPQTVFVGNVATMLTRWLYGQELAVCRHPDASTCWSLVERRLMTCDGWADAVRAGVVLDRRSIPAHSGALSAGVIWRRHASERVIGLMDRWFELSTLMPTQDDVALSAAIDDPLEVPTIVPTILPASLGTARNNVFTAVLERGCPTRPPRNSSAHRPLPVAFLFHPDFAADAPTLLRGQQLSVLLADRYPDDYDVTFTSDRRSLHQQVVIVTKGALKRLGVEELDQLRRRNVAVIACWDDLVPDPAKVMVVDAQMAVSFTQLLALRRRYPSSPAYYVTHHVNTRMPHGRPSHDRLRVGYFGEPYNTHLPSSLSGLVDVIGTDTKDASRERWMASLSAYNCHWIIRRRQQWDGSKPFLKGFVAARYGAPVIVNERDEDALYYLGDDYPFFVGSIEPVALEASFVEVSSAFGGPEWELARDIMHQVADRSSNERACEDLKFMIDSVAS